MRILAFDTSTAWMSVAVGDGASWRVHAEQTGSAASEKLLPAIDAMLRAAGLGLADLDAIAFGAGPGAFTGVRLACSVAQGLAFGAVVPVVAVPTLAALAQAAWRERRAPRVFACLDARMREVYVAAYERTGDGWRAVIDPDVVKPDAVALPAGGTWDGEGDGFAAYPSLAALDGLARVNAAAVPDARAIGELAQGDVAAGRAVRAEDARPLYVRHRVALTTAERDAGARL